MRQLAPMVLVLLLVQQAGWTVLFHGVRVSARREARARVMSGVPRSECRCFTLLATDVGKDGKGLTWEHNGEFTFEGVMYDVVRIEGSGDYVTVLAVADLKESALYQRVQDEVRRQTSQTAATSPVVLLAQHLLGQPATVAIIEGVGKPPSIDHRPSAIPPSGDPASYVSDVDPRPPRRSA